MQTQVHEEVFPELGAVSGFVYLDSARRTICSDVALDSMHRHYLGQHDFGLDVDLVLQRVRKQVAGFVGARSPDEIIFLAHAAAAHNLAAHIERRKIRPGDEIVMAVSEHHDVLLPWWRMATQAGAKVVWLDLDAWQGFPLKDLQRKVSNRTKLIILSQVSHVLGSVSPIAEVVNIAHSLKARVALDAVHSAGRMPVHVEELGVDYAVFSSPHMYGPEGLAWLYARRDLLLEAEPLLVGSNVASSVSLGGVMWQAGVDRFEAGDLHAAGIIGLGATLDYLSRLGMRTVAQQDIELSCMTLDSLRGIDGVRVFGPVEARPGIISFDVMAGGRVASGALVADIAHQLGVVLSAGTLDAQPFMHALGVGELLRASFGIYSRPRDGKALVEVVRAVQRRSRTL